MAADTRVKSIAAQKEQLGKEIIDLEQAMQAQGEKNETIRQRIEAASNEMATLQERQDQSDAAKARILARRLELNHELAQAVTVIAKLSEQETAQALASVADDAATACQPLPQ